MKPTLEAIYGQARSLLSDDSQPSGQIFVDTVLAPHVQQAIRELFRVLRGTEDPFVLQDTYFVLPANTIVLDPATMGLTNFGDVEWVEWQLPGPITAISGVVVGTVAGSPAATVTTGSPHGLVSGNTVVVYGVGGFDYFNNPNNMWSITVLSPTTFTLNGCTATGTYTSGGFVVPVSNQFTQMVPEDRLDNVATTPGANPLNVYAWQGGVLRFYPASQPMLLRIVYRTSGSPSGNPQTIVPIDDSQDYLATRAAGMAAKSRGADQTGAALTMEAVGPTGQADGEGGLLRQLVQIDIRNMQRIQYRMNSFRARRNRRDMLLF